MLVWCLSLCIALLANNISQAQSVPAFPINESLSLFGIKIIPEAQIGYQKQSFNFNMPASLSIGYSTTLDLKFRDANVWVGALSATAEFPSGLAFTIAGQANAKRNILVYEQEEFVLGATEGVTWTGSQLEWWTIDGRAMYPLNADYSMVIGLRRDHLTVNLDDPRDGYGNPLNFNQSGIIGGLPYSMIQYCSSDLISKIWIPYFGVQIAGPGYRASLTGSPFASAEIKVPVALLYDLNLTVARLITGESLLYRVNKPALFLEGNFQYDLKFSPAFNIGLWCNASWLGLRGQGKWSYDYRGEVPPNPPNYYSENQTNTTTYTRCMVGGGLSAVWSF
jgi:hypothetical protein